MHTIATHRPWYRRLIDETLDHLLAPGRPATRLRDLDARTLADIGIDASEIDSIEAESRSPRTGITRRRIALANH
jgi:hypothetical protein